MFRSEFLNVLGASSGIALNRSMQPVFDILPCRLASRSVSGGDVFCGKLSPYAQRSREEKISLGYNTVTGLERSIERSSPALLIQVRA
jgi:hypothetical protein